MCDGRHGYLFDPRVKERAMSYKSVARDCGHDVRPSPARDPAVAIDASQQASRWRMSLP
jgi:hypothetical protein